MDGIFLRLVDVSLTASIAIAVLLALRPLLKKSPSFIRCILWAVVLLRLAIPIQLDFTGLEMSGVPSASEVFGDERPYTPPVENTGTESYAPPILNGGTANTPTQPPVITPDVGEDDVVTPPAVTEKDESKHTAEGKSKGASALDVISAVWACGVAAMLLYVLTSSITLWFKTRGAVVYDSRIRVISAKASPFIKGIIRPTIYIPAQLPKSSWEHIIAHESAHIKRLDHLLKPFAFIVLAVYWMNPLVWAAYVMLCKDIEYACDEKVVKNMEHSERQKYSLSLLSCTAEKGLAFAHPLAFGKVSVKERIKRVMKYKISVWAICLSLIVSTVLVFLLACSPSAPSDGISSDSTESSDSSTDSSEETSGEESGSDYADPKISYATQSDIDNDPNAIFYDDGGDEIVKIQVTEKVTYFSFVRFAVNETTVNPPNFPDYSFFARPHEVLYEVGELTPEKSFYVKTTIKGASILNKGISYEDSHKYPVRARIAWNADKGKPGFDLLTGAYPTYTASGTKLINAGPITDKLYTTDFYNKDTRHHIPVRIDTVAELEEFKNKYNEALRLEVNGKEKTFYTETADYDEEFFKDNSLVLIYFGSGSVSNTFKIQSALCRGNTLCVQLWGDYSSYHAMLPDGWIIAMEFKDYIAGRIIDCKMIIDSDDNKIDAIKVPAYWTDCEEVVSEAINGELVESSGDFPVYLLDTKEDVKEFRNAFENRADGMGFDFDMASPGDLSLNGIIATWEDPHYVNASLLLVYVRANSGTYDYAVKGVSFKDTDMCIEIEQTNNPTEVTDDLAGWIFYIRVNDNLMANCSFITAKQVS